MQAAGLKEWLQEQRWWEGRESEKRGAGDRLGILNYKRVWNGEIYALGTELDRELEMGFAFPCNIDSTWTEMGKKNFLASGLASLASLGVRTVGGSGGGQRAAEAISGGRERDSLVLMMAIFRHLPLFRLTEKDLFHSIYSILTIKKFAE